MKRRSLYFALIMALVLTLMVGCVGNKKREEILEGEMEDMGEEGEEENIPILNIGYIFSNHQAPLMVAGAKNGEFEDKGIYLKEIEDKENYILISNDEEIAKINFVAARDGEEVMDKMNQGDLQIGLSNIEDSLMAIDKGRDIRILGPINVDGMGLVVPVDSSIDDLGGFIEYVRGQHIPVKIGYQAPDSLPLILFKRAMEEMDIKITENLEDMDADILLFNLKGTANLIPALTSGRVDGWIGASPFPELAETEEVGKVIADIKDIPSIDRWSQFPSCVLSATGEVVEEYPMELEQFFKLLTFTSQYANENKEEMGKLVADWTGISEEAAAATTTVYTTEFNEKWFNNIDLIIEYLQKAGKLEEELKDKKLGDVRDKVFKDIK